MPTPPCWPAPRYRKELHTVTLYAVIAVASAVAAVWEIREADVVFAFILVPVGLSVLFGRDFRREARLAEDRILLERRAEEVLTQEELAPRRWAGRLAPEDLPDFAGLRARPGVPGRHRADGGRLLRRVPRGAHPHRRGDRRRHRPRHRAVDHRLPGQVPAAGVPPPVPRPGPGARGAQPPDVGARARRGVHLALRRRVRHRGRHPARTPRPATRRRGCGTTARCGRCGPPVRC